MRATYIQDATEWMAGFLFSLFFDKGKGTFFGDRYVWTCE